MHCVAGDGTVPRISLVALGFLADVAGRAVRTGHANSRDMRRAVPLRCAVYACLGAEPRESTYLTLQISHEQSVEDLASLV